MIVAGTKLGRHEIRSKIGAGLMGEVYLARDTKLDQRKRNPMKRNISAVSAITLIVLAFLCLPQAHKAKARLIASPAAKSKTGMAEKIIGTWRLISIEDHRTNRPENEFNPTGYIMYDSTGHMAVQITRHSDRAKFASEDIANVTTQEKAAAFSSYAAYYGTYTVNEAERTITHHVEGSWTPNDVGKDFVRYFRRSGNRITLMPTETNAKLGTSTPLRSLTWERVK